MSHTYDKVMHAIQWTHRVRVAQETLRLQNARRTRIFSASETVLTAQTTIPSHRETHLVGVKCGIGLADSSGAPSRQKARNGFFSDVR